MAKEGKIDIDAMMAVYKKVGTPGDVHRLLAGLAGTWTTRTRSWMGPDRPPVESNGTCESEVLLGGRFLQQIYTGDMMGTPFTGINLLGYNNHTKKYVSTWIDSMSTSIFYFEGTASADGKTITQECSYDDPARGPMKWRSVSRIKDGNALEFEMYLTPKGGREEKAMEMTLSRKEARASKAA